MGAHNASITGRRLLPPELGELDDAKIYQMYASGTVVTDVAECDPDDLDTHLKEWD